MGIRVAINGFGRIGRGVFRIIAARDESEIQVVAINDLADDDVLAYLLKYDTVMGKFDGDVSVADGVMVAGCLEGDCHYQRGNLHARQRVERVHKLLEQLGMEPERVRMFNMSSGMGQAWAEAVKAYGRVVEAKVPAADEALKRIEKIKNDNWLKFQQVGETENVGQICNLPPVHWRADCKSAPQSRRGSALRGFLAFLFARLRRLLADLQPHPS